MGFLQHIEATYGGEAAAKMKQWASIIRKLANFNNHVKFLMQCRRKGVLPKHIMNTVKCTEGIISKDNPFVDRMYNTIYVFQKNILNIEISYYHWTIKNLKASLNSVTDGVQLVIPNNIFLSFKERQDIFYRQHLSKIKKKQIRKLNRLINEKINLDNNENNNNSINNNWLVNFSNNNVPENVKNVLSLGEKFNLPHISKKLPIQQLVIDIEYILGCYTDEDTRIRSRNNAINTITNYIKSINAKKKTSTKMIKKYKKI